MNFSSFLSMGKEDWMNSIGTLIFSAVIGTLYTLTTTPNFNFATLDWHMVLNMMVVAVITSVAKSSTTTADGKLMGTLKIK